MTPAESTLRIHDRSLWAPPPASPGRATADSPDRSLPGRKTEATRPWVLLDRDGTLNRECHYLNDPARLELLPGALEGLVELGRAGVGLAVVTNQSGLARGLITEDQLRAIHQRLDEWFCAAGVEVVGYYICPHGPEAQCGCRKPAVGLAEQAARDWGMQWDRTFVVGDKPADLGLARAIGATPVLVQTGYGLETERSLSTADRAGVLVVADLQAAAQSILARLAAPPAVAAPPLSHRRPA